MGFAYIIPKYLAQGSVPLDYDLRGRFDTVVLCAEELQDVPLPGVEVIHAPLDDAKPTQEEVSIAWKAAKRVAKRVNANRRVLVTCAMGLNRSGLVTGFTLIMLGFTAQQAIDVIRMARGQRALFNEHFVKLLSRVRPAGAGATP
jgi:protein-tyrosine phosphatase